MSVISTPKHIIIVENDYGGLMIRIERNTANLFPLLQFIAFVINTFSHLTGFYSKRLPRKCKTTSRKEVRGFELATLQIQTGRRNLCTSYTLPSGITTKKSTI